MVLGLLCPIGITGFAAIEMRATSQTFWLVLLIVLAQFVVRRFR